MNTFDLNLSLWRSVNELLDRICERECTKSNSVLGETIMMGKHEFMGLVFI